MPQLQTSQPRMLEGVPSENKLKMLIEAGLTDTARDMIARNKLPYIIIIDKETGKEALRSAFSQGELFLQQFITEDPETIQMKEDAWKMAISPHEVLILGETGTGKELLAKSMIGKREGPIKSVNCAGLPIELVESELFGHVEGAFTGARRTVDGLFTLAKDGVMFMDEIGDLPLSVQAKVLRALQDKKIRKVGGKVEEDINCKFVCATHRKLKKMVEEGTFRRDLYARISTLELCIKPLRERRCDIIPIALSMPGGKEFVDKFRDEIEAGGFDLSLNVRSIQQLVTRYSVLGRLTMEK